MPREVVGSMSEWSGVLMKTRGRMDARSEVILYLDDSPASQEAVRLLSKKEVPFQVIPVNGHNVPTLSYGTVEYGGLRNIRYFLLHVYQPSYALDASNAKLPSAAERQVPLPHSRRRYGKLILLVLAGLCLIVLVAVIVTAASSVELINLRGAAILLITFLFLAIEVLLGMALPPKREK